MTTQPNFLRMIHLAEEFFETKNDPDQISVDETVLDQLRRLHPSTIGEEATADGPVAWTLVIPTTENVMRQFLAKKISERELLDRSQPGDRIEALYLCSALVLPEYRGRGLATKLLLHSIEVIRETHAVSSLYCWAFSVEGRRLATSIAGTVQIPLLERR